MEQPLSAEEASLNDSFTTGRRKGGTLKKLKKSQSGSALNNTNKTNNVVSLNDLFGKGVAQNGGFGAPVIDMGASFTNGSAANPEDYNFGSDNPFFVNVDDDGQEIPEEETEEEGSSKSLSRYPRRSTKGKRWTLSSFGSFLRKSNEKTPLF